MKHYALIGFPLGHSLSQQLFEQNVPPEVADYRLCPLPTLDGLRLWVKENDISGFNVTSPYKEAILPFLDSLSPEAETIGAVNCVKVTGSHLTGYNTDAPAFRQTLEETLSRFHFPISTFQSTLILGTGGAAKAVAYALNQIGIRYTFVSRLPEQHINLGSNIISYKQLSTFNFPACFAGLEHLRIKTNSCEKLSTLIINATPVGMYPNTDATPLPSEFQHSTFNIQLCYDLIYNPSPTRLMRDAAARGAKVVDGLAMLHLQAKLSRDIFFTDNTEYQPLAK